MTPDAFDGRDSEAARRVVIDTDTASDDAVAILLATRSERLTVEGLTVVAGNTTFEREHVNVIVVSV